MKLSTTAALFALAAAQGANAVDFDFRDFEGLWESPNLAIVRPANIAGNLGQTSLVTIECKATGDFRKAMCELSAVLTDSRLCSVNPNQPNAVADAKFILDQFDADTGMTKVLMGKNVQCCSPDPTVGCSDIAVSFFDPRLTDGMMNFQLTMLPGKSNNHVRAIAAKFGTGVDEPFGIVEADLQLRRTAGGFKSYN